MSIDCPAAGQLDIAGLKGTCGEESTQHRPPLGSEVLSLSNASSEETTRLAWAAILSAWDQMPYQHPLCEVQNRCRRELGAPRPCRSGKRKNRPLWREACSGGHAVVRLTFSR